jgi:hypothetical protein
VSRGLGKVQRLILTSLEYAEWPGRPELWWPMTELELVPTPLSPAMSASCRRAAHTLATAGLVDLKYLFGQSIDHTDDDIDRGYRASILLRRPLSNLERLEERRLMEQYWEAESERDKAMSQIRKVLPGIYSTEIWVRHPDTRDHYRRWRELTDWVVAYMKPELSGAALASDGFLMDDPRGSPSREKDENFRRWLDQKMVQRER